MRFLLLLIIFAKQANKLKDDENLIIPPTYVSRSILIPCSMRSIKKEYIQSFSPQIYLAGQIHFALPSAALAFGGASGGPRGIQTSRPPNPKRLLEFKHGNK